MRATARSKTARSRWSLNLVPTSHQIARSLMYVGRSPETHRHRLPAPAAFRRFVTGERDLRMQQLDFDAVRLHWKRVAGKEGLPSCTVFQLRCIGNVGLCDEQNMACALWYVLLCTRGSCVFRATTAAEITAPAPSGFSRRTVGGLDGCTETKAAGGPPL